MRDLFLAAQAGDEIARLGLTIGEDRLTAQNGAHLLDQLRAMHAAAHRHRAQRQRQRIAALRLHHRGQQLRRDAEHVAAQRGGHLSRGLCVEMARRQGDRRPNRQMREKQARPADMKERQREQQVRLFGAVQLGRHRIGRYHLPLLREQAPLGMAGGAAGIKHDPRQRAIVVRLNRLRIATCISPREQRFIFILARTADDHRGQPCVRPFRFRQAGRAEQDARLGIADDPAQLDGRQPPVERQQDRPQPRGGEIQLDQRQAVDQQCRDPVSPPDATQPQRAREPLDPLVKFPIAQPPVAVRDGKALREAAPDAPGPGRRRIRRRRRGGCEGHCPPLSGRRTVHSAVQTTSSPDRIFTSTSTRPEPSSARQTRTTLPVPVTLSPG